jgi:hypothetical protein
LLIYRVGRYSIVVVYIVGKVRVKKSKVNILDSIETGKLIVEGHLISSFFKLIRSNLTSKELFNP